MAVKYIGNLMIIMLFAMIFIAAVLQHGLLLGVGIFAAAALVIGWLMLAVHLIEGRK
jgi:hypothetical protein